MTIADKSLQKIVTNLARKPRHETVRAELYRLLVDGLEVDLTKVHLEKSLKEVRGRIDALLGRSVFEIKSDLASELNDAEVQLLKYLQNKEGETGKSYIGIATDGALFRVYVRKNHGQDKADDVLELMDEYKTDSNKPRELLVWLESVLVLKDDLLPEAEVIKIELGRESTFYRRTLKEIHRLWHDLQDDSEVATKYEIWKRLLKTAYGSEVEESDLFLQHTYLIIVAKSIATAAFFEESLKCGEDLLSGERFNLFGVSGAIESDFFDWVLSHADGDKLVMDVAQHTKKFKWSEIQTDILKILYENLMDPSQRRDLGEYYTPDWLAEKICREVITDPLEMRITDPTCGSGTFLFHAIRLGLEYAEKNKISSGDAIRKLTINIVGIDVHPVAVIFARVTYLLALLPALRIGNPERNISLPVYLGDSLQWDIKQFGTSTDLEITVPALEGIDTNGNGGNKRLQLRFPTELVADPFFFNEIMDVILSSAESKIPPKDFGSWANAKGISPEHVKRLVDIYSTLCDLQAEKRNHIWGYVARNLSRPAWLAGDNQKAHVVIGNPPWRSYRKMSADIQKDYQKEMRKMDLWSTKATSTQDLACYCYVRCMELYMRHDGIIAFVMPYAAMISQPYENFRAGKFLDKDSKRLYFEINKAWAFPADVQPLFPVPACVLFATYAPPTRKLPKKVTYFSGKLARRDAKSTEATKTLTHRSDAWPLENKIESLYGRRFRKGASFMPRRFCFIERLASNIMQSQKSPMVEGKKGGQKDKVPWINISPPKGKVEAEFIYPVFKGESIAQYRIISPSEAVVPWSKRFQMLFNSKEAMHNGYADLSKWLGDIEAKCRKQNPNDDFKKRIDNFRGISSQFPVNPLRVVYATSGTHPAATIIRDKDSLIDIALYWMATENVQEAYYLLAILNSETTRAAAEHWQAEGQWGKRHFAKVMFNLPIPEFSDKQALHIDLANAAKTAEEIATKVPLKEGEYFTNTRKRIRNALREHGIAKKIDDLVATLLNLPK